MDDVERPGIPVSPIDTFIDSEQQAVLILGGAIEEIMLADTLAENLWEKTLCQPSATALVFQRRLDQRRRGHVPKA